ncbi:S1 family peptidase [bacterium]|nr:S1 family peptidase [bacterium]
MKRLYLQGIPQLNILLLLAAVLLVLTACSEQSTEPAPYSHTANVTTLSKDNPGIRRAMEVQERNTERFLAMKDVVGIGTGMTEEGNPALVILTKKELPKGRLPEMVEGLMVLQHVGGAMEITGKPGTTGSTKKSGNSGAAVDLGQRLTRPVPIGVSTSNYYDCGAGTIGVRVKSNDAHYILSCNHVFARLNAGGSGEVILQPGRADNGCTTVLNDEVARLADMQTIDYSPYANNLMDAAVASTTTAMVDNSTPLDGYGVPSSTTMCATVGMEVQKYGRRTGLTQGRVVAINCSVVVPYPAGPTRFVDQIVVEPLRKNKSFVEGGDSGSLVVTDDSNANPIGLVYAKSGDLAFVNPIDPILQRFGVQIDGK